MVLPTLYRANLTSNNHQDSAPPPTQTCSRANLIKASPGRDFSQMTLDSECLVVTRKHLSPSGSGASTACPCLLQGFLLLQMDFGFPEHLLVDFLQSLS